ncbi:LlaJI family restriction endonuclease [Altererythrobacter rubellus]|uniref:LlaJI family restriction endonuclease n=1 Tax=Altererythrobacter rubellus TaxID=2173831 RepID=A0A9Y2B9L2_9SPHN|nr:LlaJI family restriction endonuclease [Altererythrobacter rubellus]WIW95467.1 LlaJI family restriction endonuclease [Altererythrobacter rubellus]
MTILFLPDRYPKTKLASRHPEVASNLQKASTSMMENGQKTVAWVGVARADAESAVVFLPHGSPAGAPEREAFARDLMKAIVRFAREHARAGEGGDNESTTQTALLAELAMDFRDFGLYSTREKIRGRRDGKPDWARTVKSGAAFPASNGAPVYFDIATSRYSSFATNVVARIQAAVISEINELHGWWVGHYFGAREVPRAAPDTVWPRKIWPRLLRLARRELFQSRAVNLVRMLLDYLEGSMETGDGRVVCGVSDFSTMWETMLRDTLDGVEAHWNSYLPGPVYMNAWGHGDEAGRMELDIVVRKGDRIVILDAKYYRADSSTFVPGVQDISKQIIYQRAVESTGRVAKDRITNAFIFPAETTCRNPYKAIRFFLPDGSPASGFPPVECQFVSVPEVVTAYASRGKLADQSWLPALYSIPAIAS